MTAPKTIAYSPIDGTRVNVWDNELDAIRPGVVAESDNTVSTHGIVVMLDATEWEPAQRVIMPQGPYTDDGRYRIVGEMAP